MDQPSSRDASGEDSTAPETTGLYQRAGNSIDAGNPPAKRLRSATHEKATNGVSSKDAAKEDGTDIADRDGQKSRKSTSSSSRGMDDEGGPVSMAPPPIGSLTDPVGYKTNIPEAGRAIRVYADGVFDLFHLG